MDGVKKIHMRAAILMPYLDQARICQCTGFITKNLVEIQTMDGSMVLVIMASNIIQLVESSPAGKPEVVVKETFRPVSNFGNHALFSMTSLLLHTVAQPTKWRFFRRI